ncbi:unnamed protein product [Pedinophyceae sp. YPF-701]|nr:unnamed protein product [Pedinophyceae sp. YPF-701]
MQRRVRCSAIKSLQEQLRNKERSAVEIAEEFLKRIAATDNQVRAFITVDEEGARKAAAKIDEAIAAGANLGPLAGIPVTIKDNICVRGLPTTAASQILKNYRPTHDATAVRKLLDAGAVPLGKTNMDEFGMGSSTENSSFHVSYNPWDVSRVSGGSSGGSAAAVAAQQCVASLGSDTGGSIRQPASFCGVVGIKPTYGRVSRWGLVSYASSLDTIGPLAATVEDAAIVLDAISGVDRFDATSADTAGPSTAAGLLSVDQLGSAPLKGKRLGLVREALGEGVDPGVDAAVRAAAAHMQSLGAEVEEVSLPIFDKGLPAYYVIALSEASSNLSRYDGVRYGSQADAEDLRGLYGASREALGAEVRRRILMGTYALSAGYYDAYYKQAQQVRTRVRGEINDALQAFDALIMPCAPTPAFRVGEKTKDPLSMYKGDLMTVNVNLAGNPAISVPCGFVEEGGVRLPVGLQLIGRHMQEADIISTADAYQKTASLDLALPTL